MGKVLPTFRIKIASHIPSMIFILFGIVLTPPAMAAGQPTFGWEFQPTNYINKGETTAVSCYNDTTVPPNGSPFPGNVLACINVKGKNEMYIARIDEDGEPICTTDKISSKGPFSLFQQGAEIVAFVETEKSKEYFFLKMNPETCEIIDQTIIVADDKDTAKPTYVLPYGPNYMILYKGTKKGTPALIVNGQTGDVLLKLYLSSIDNPKQLPENKSLITNCDINGDNQNDMILITDKDGKIQVYNL